MMENTTDGMGRAWPWMVAGGAAGLTALPLLLFWQRLPDPLTVRWSLSGAASGPMPKLMLLLLCWAMLTLFAWLASRRTADSSMSVDTRKGAEAGALALMSIGGMLMPSIAALCVALNLDRPDWRQAAPLTPGGFGAIFVPSVLALILGFAARALRGPGTSDPKAGTPQPTDPLGSRGATAAPESAGDSPATWTGQAANRLTLPIIVVLGAASIYLGYQGHVALALLQLPAIVVLELLSRIRVTVDAADVTIHYGHFGWVQQRISMARVGSASVTPVGAFSPYGWGYRGSLTLLKRAAVIIRSGAGLRLDLMDGRRFLVTVDDAESASRLINRFRAQRT
jgi:hypothetical protein